MSDKVLLFDFDGTIAETGDATVRIYNEIARENNFRQITKENLPALRNRSAMENVRDFQIPLLKLPFIASKVRSAMKNEIPNLKSIAGIREQLQLLKDRGFKLYIVSSNSSENISSFLDHNQISEFEGIFSVSRLFGKDAKIRSLIKANGWDQSSVMYVGDEVRDILAAKKAKVKSVAVAWGYNTEEVLAKNNPDILLREPKELGSI